MGSIGTTEIIIIVLILLLLFGGKKIPELMRGLGSGVKEFKKATTAEEEAEQQRSYDRQLDNRRYDDRRLDDRRVDDRPADDTLREGERRHEAR